MWVMHTQNGALQTKLTNSCSGDRIGVILIGFQSVEDVSCGMQGARPDDAQAGEVQRQQAQLADQTVLLQRRQSRPQMNLSQEC